MLINNSRALDARFSRVIWGHAPTENFEIQNPVNGIFCILSGDFQSAQKFIKFHILNCLVLLFASTLLSNVSVMLSAESGQLADRRTVFGNRDEQRSYADNTTKLATHSEVTGDHVIQWQDADMTWSSRLRGLRSKNKGFDILYCLL